VRSRDTATALRERGHRERSRPVRRVTGPGLAVVVGGYVNALTVVRALGALGVRSVVVTHKPFDVAHRSRFCVERVHLPGLHADPGSLVGLLEARRDRWRGAAVFPTNDFALEALSREHERLSSWYVPVANPWEVTEPLLDKHRLHDVARAVGIDVPLSYGLAGAGASSGANDAAPGALRTAEIRFPVVVKPLRGQLFAERFGVKLFVARDSAELERAVAKVVAAGLEAEVLDLIPGPDALFLNEALYLDERGRVLGRVAMHKLRKSPPFFGVCRVAETWESDELHERTVELLRRIGHVGAANAEYKRDPRDGRYRLMEVNGRPFLMQALARRADIDLPALAWRHRVLGEHRTASRNGWQGVWINASADLGCALAYHGEERLGLGDYLAPYLRPKSFATWSFRDPAPWAAHWTRAARDALGLLASGARRRATRARLAATAPPQA